MSESEFESGRMENYRRDFYNVSHAWMDEQGSYWRSHPRNREHPNSVETTEDVHGYVFRIPLSEVSTENLKILPTDSYIIVQSSKKTIFLSLESMIFPKSLRAEIKEDMLILRADKS